MAMSLPLVLILRILQALFAVIVLGLTAAVANWYNMRFSGSPGSNNFLLFCAVWSLLIALPYLTFSLKYYPKAAHKFAILGVEFVTMVFWFAGFIALAAYVGTFLAVCGGYVCRSMQAAAVFGAFDFVLFAATMAISAHHVYKTRNSSSTEPAPAMQTV